MCRCCRLLLLLFAPLQVLGAARPRHAEPLVETHARAVDHLLVELVVDEYQIADEHIFVARALMGVGRVACVDERRVALLDVHEVHKVGETLELQELDRVRADQVDAVRR